MPPPEDLRKYEDTLPGSAERMMRMAERSHDHKISLTEKAVDANIANEKLGMYCGAFLFALLILVSLVAFLETGNVLAPVAFMGPAVIGVISLFIRRGYGRERRGRPQKPRL